MVPGKAQQFFFHCALAPRTGRRKGFATPPRGWSLREQAAIWSVRESASWSERESASGPFAGVSDL
eukprot:2033212-Pyramimonas_sp.AAC.1